MEYKLKSGSSILIKNAEGNDICSVAEDGTVSGFGGGTKLYKHQIKVDSTTDVFVINTQSSNFIPTTVTDIRDYIQQNDLVAKMFHTGLTSILLSVTGGGGGQPLTFYYEHSGQISSYQATVDIELVSDTVSAL